LNAYARRADDRRVKPSPQAVRFWGDILGKGGRDSIVSTDPRWQSAISRFGRSDDPASSENSASPQISSGAAPKRVVVVEDELLIRLHIESELMSAGFDVAGMADNADAAIRLAEHQRPDLILMDLRLRGPRDGIDAALEIWRRFEIRCLFISGNLDDFNRQRAAPAKPWGFLPKPFTGDQLVAAISHPAD